MDLDNPLRDCKPPGPCPLLARDRAIGLLKFMEQLDLIRVGNAWAGITRSDPEPAIYLRALDANFSIIGKLDGRSREQLGFQCVLRRAERPLIGGDLCQEATEVKRPLRQSQ